MHNASYYNANFELLGLYTVCIGDILLAVERVSNVPTLSLLKQDRIWAIKAPTMTSIQKRTRTTWIAFRKRGAQQSLWGGIHPNCGWGGGENEGR